MYLDKRYYERKKMKSKEVEDVLGGAESWKNVDKTEVNCANERCENRSAYFRQVQIRSADEPMTTFYKVSYSRRYGAMDTSLTGDSVRDARLSGAKTEGTLYQAFVKTGRLG